MGKRRLHTIKAHLREDEKWEAGAREIEQLEMKLDRAIRAFLMMKAYGYVGIQDFAEKELAALLLPPCRSCQGYGQIAHASPPVDVGLDIYKPQVATKPCPDCDGLGAIKPKEHVS